MEGERGMTQLQLTTLPTTPHYNHMLSPAQGLWARLGKEAGGAAGHASRPRHADIACDLSAIFYRMHPLVYRVICRDAGDPPMRLRGWPVAKLASPTGPPARPMVQACPR